MNERILLQVTDVLYKYNKNYSKNGVLANLDVWESSKGPLVDLLRKHPDWNEDALAVVFEVTQSREIDRYAVNTYNSGLHQLVGDLELSGEDADRLHNALNTAVGAYAKLLPDEQVASSIKEYSGVSCVAGQKASRVIHKICQKYGLDKHPEYNARFAKLADSLNPLQVRRKALLSVHPCDFLEMSNEENSWSSCHCIREGEYHAGTLSYMNDAVSMIFYTTDANATGNYHTEPKITRQVFCYGDGILLQSRLYPQTDDEEARDIYRDIVQRTISLCLGAPNLWTLKRTPEDVERCCRTHADALHYKDYTYSCYKSTISVIKSLPGIDGNRIVIGSVAYCLECTDKLSSTESLYCSGCDYSVDFIACEDCGGDIRYNSDDDYCVNGSHYCRDCVSWCENCQEYTRDVVVDARDRSGYPINVCERCREESYDYCEDCGRCVHIDGGEMLDDGYHCRECLDSRYYTCTGCCEYVCAEDVLEVDGRLYCMNCAEEIRAQEDVEAECFIAV